MSTAKGSFAKLSSIIIIIKLLLYLYIIIYYLQIVQVMDLLQFRGKIEIEFGREDELHHYEITPYNYKPQVAKKITLNTYYDLGQGLMNQIYDLEMTLDQKNGSKKVSLRKRKK